MEDFCLPTWYVITLRVPTEKFHEKKQGLLDYITQIYPNILHSTSFAVDVSKKEFSENKF